MLKILPFVLIPLLLFAGLGYWRFVYTPKQALLNTSQPSSAPQVNNEPLEVPKTLPDATVEDKVKLLENTLTNVVTQLNTLKSSSSSESNSSLDTRLSGVEASITEIKARLSVLEKASPAPASSSKTTIYIPLGSGGGPWTNTDWFTLTDYQITLDPSNFPGYTGMVLELTMRMVESDGTGYIRLYNTTDSSTVSSEVKTSTTSFGLYTSLSFNLSSGSKTYALQVKSPNGKNVVLQTARIKVNF